jgi:hypothetical protein
MIENAILLMIGLFVFCLVAVVGEYCGKKFGWE